MIERILKDIITCKSPAVEKSAIKSEKMVDKPTKNGNKKDKLNDILNSLSKSDIERGLRDEGLSTSGSKEEMIVRLLAATKNDPKRTLMSLDGQKLNAYAEENDIPRRRSKEDQVNEILKMEFGMDALTTNDNSKVTKDVRAVESVKSPQVVPSVVSKQKDADFINVIEAIKGWIPQIGHPTEDGYRTALSAELQFRHHFPVELEAGATG